MKTSRRLLSLAILPLAIVGCVLLVGCGQKTTTSSPTIKEAEILYDMGKNQEALDYYNQKLASDPKDLNALIVRGKILAKFGRYDEAINDFYKASKLDDTQESYMLYKGLLTMQSAIDVNALDSLDYSGTKNLDMFTFYHCILLSQLNKNTETNACLDKLLAIDNNNPQGNYLKGKTLIKTEKRKDAIKYFNKAEAGGLSTQELYSNKALALAKANMTGAIEYADKAIDINSNDTGAYYAKALGSFNLGNWDKGLTAIEEALKSNAENKNYLWLKGDLLMRTENYGMAIKAYDDAFKLDNTNSNILSRKAIALYYKGDKKAFAQTIIQIEDIINDNANRYSNFVIVLIISKDYQKAITYINKGLALTPNHDYLTFNKALTYYLMKDYKNADLRYSNLWKDYKPEEAKIIYADYLLSQSDYIGAANTVESVLTKYPDNALALASKVVIFDEMHRMGKTVPDSSFDYKTPSVVENAKNKLGRYRFLKNYR